MGNQSTLTERLPFLATSIARKWGIRRHSEKMGIEFEAHVPTTLQSLWRRTSFDDGRTRPLSCACVAALARGAGRGEGETEERKSKAK